MVNTVEHYSHQIPLRYLHAGAQFVAENTLTGERILARAATDGYTILQIREEYLRDTQTNNNILAELRILNLDETLEGESVLLTPEAGWVALVGPRSAKTYADDLAEAILLGLADGSEPVETDSPSTQAALLTLTEEDVHALVHVCLSGAREARRAGDSKKMRRLAELSGLFGFAEEPVQVTAEDAALLFPLCKEASLTAWRDNLSGTSDRYNSIAQKLIF